MATLPESWQEAKVIVESIGIFAAIGSAIFAIKQYYRQNDETEKKRIPSRTILKCKINALRTSSFKSSDVSRADKDFLLGLFEEVLVMTNLITSAMAFYGFGAYALEIYDNIEPAPACAEKRLLLLHADQQLGPRVHEPRRAFDPLARRARRVA